MASILLSSLPSSLWSPSLFLIFFLGFFFLSLVFFFIGLHTGSLAHLPCSLPWNCRSPPTCHPPLLSTWVLTWFSDLDFSKPNLSSSVNLVHRPVPHHHLPWPLRFPLPPFGPPSNTYAPACGLHAPECGSHAPT